MDLVNTTLATAMRRAGEVAGERVTLAAALFVVVVLVIALLAGSRGLAIYTLSFWHYLVYALAFLWRCITPERFQRDAVLLKTISLVALASAFLPTLPSLLAILVMAAGFALNNAAYRALGDARTFYGVELEALPPARLTAFPYSVTAHPMLIGNMAGYGGALLDEGFRQDWWPLAVLHVVLNFAIILMEARGRQSRRAGTLVPVLALAAGSLLLLIAFADVWPFTLATLLAAAAFGALLFRRYATAAGPGDT
jgi:hypothetical protein